MTSVHNSSRTVSVGTIEVEHKPALDGPRVAASESASELAAAPGKAAPNPFAGKSRDFWLVSTHSRCIGQPKPHV